MKDQEIIFPRLYCCWIRDGYNQDPEPEVNIPDPQHFFRLGGTGT
jgi:hypothetical protein